MSASAKSSLFILLPSSAVAAQIRAKIERRKSCSSFTDVPDLARQHRPEALARNAACVERGEKPLARFLDRFVGEMKRSPMAARRERRIAETHTRDSLFGILVLRL